MTVLAGDIGGTKTLLQLSEPSSSGFDVLYQKRYLSADYDNFLSVLLAFAEECARHVNARAASACFGVAGPVSGRSAKTTNLPWTLNADELEAALGIPRVKLINDFQSVGYGIEFLQPEDIVTLQQGIEVQQGSRAIIGAGTGLGQGFLVWQDDHYEVLASEGGHTDFSPIDDLQIGLLQYLRKRYCRATWERAVSGRGLVNVFEFLLETHQGQMSSVLQQALQHEDHAAVISRFGLTGQDPLAAQALDLFTRLYGAQTGNLALTGLATGGVYVAGGVAPKIIDKLADGVFMDAFLNKEERMQALLKSIPVKVVVNTDVGLLGSAAVAARLV